MEFMRYLKGKLLYPAMISLLLALLAQGVCAASFPAGLWVGQVQVNQVTNVNDPSGAKTTGAPMMFKVILHQDDGGTVRLLKAVVQMWKDGSLNANGTVAQPGSYVLVTDPAQIPTFKGVALRDNQPVARRVSTTNYDFAGNELACSGSIGTAGTVTCAIPLSAAQPTNPFLHRFHPQHDNLSADYSAPADPPEVFPVTRTLTLTFAAPANPPPAWGSTQLSGAYSETLAGLHQQNLAVAGTFSLTRASQRGKLNE
jgi:hypothetical protein